MFWHSEQRGKDRNYHLKKLDTCKSNGIELIHINDFLWHNKKEIVKDIIAKRLGIISNKVFARKCKVQHVTNQVASNFVEDNHLQGAVNCKYAIGLYYENELISVMTFSKARFSRSVEYELCRFCNKIGVTVVGGFSRMLKRFIRDTNCKSLVSYCDVSLFSGNIYKQHGFTLMHRSSPNYKYFKVNSSPLELFSRNKFQKHKLSVTLNEFSEKLTEYENMLANGYDRIWDCGNDVYTLTT